MASTWFAWGMLILLLLLTSTLVAAALRVVRGPHLADRVVALDLVAYVSVCLIGAAAILTDDSTIVDVALVLSLLAFLGTIAFARLLERQASGEGS